jgi:hypothetical protein
VVNDTLPTTLIQFGGELERAIARELVTPAPTPPPRRCPRRHRRMAVGAVAGCAVAVAAAGVAIVAIGDGSTSSAWGLHVLRAAEIALPKPASNTILYVSVTQTMTPAARRDADNAAPTVDAVGWFQQGPPSRWVTRETVPGRTPIWLTDSGIYDPAAKRVFPYPSLPSAHPRYRLVKTGQDGFYTLRIATSQGPVHQTISAAQARGLRSGADQILWIEGWNGHEVNLQAIVAASSSRSLQASVANQPNDTSLSFPARLHQLLQSGQARVAGRVTVDGRRAIKIAIPAVNGRLWMTYYVDPATYRPIELDSYGFGNPKDDTRLVFHGYQQLPTKGNARLLRLHTSPGTSLDHSVADFYRHAPSPLFW